MEYGSTTSLGSSTAPRTPGGFESPMSVTSSAAGYFQAVAYNSAGHVLGKSQVVKSPAERRIRRSLPRVGGPNAAGRIGR